MSTSYLKSPEVRVVEASAGSGKTFSLAKRYIQLLFSSSVSVDVLPMRSILAITFTNKASLEMKERILLFLKLLALKQMPDHLFKEIVGEFKLSPEQASVRAGQIMGDLIRHYNFFQVQTIDKFINALLSGCSFKIGLTANFRIKTQSFEYLERSLDSLLEQSPKNFDVVKSFEEFLHHYLYIENRTGWFPKKDMMAILFNLYQQYNIYGLSFVQSHVSAHELIKYKKTVLADMKSLRDQIEGISDGRFYKGLVNFIDHHPISFDVDDLSDYWARSEPPIKKGQDVSKDVYNLWESIQKNIRTICLAESFSLFDPYINIFNQVQKIFLEMSVKDDVLFLEELNCRARELFDKEYVTVEELYFRLAARFRHYLIDEFQDTSQQQWHNLQKMVEEALSTGGTFFYVGDRKQAIYSFRGGDAKLFDSVQRKFEHFNVCPERLLRNFRSHKAIVEFNNKIFGADNLRDFLTKKEHEESQKNKKNFVSFSEENLKTLEHIYNAAHQQNLDSLDSGYITVEYVDIDKKAERDEFIRQRLIEHLDDVGQRFSKRDIAILARSNSEVEQITSWLLQEKILVESERTSNIKENPYIQQLIAFLKFLDSPIDNLSFSQFILGDLFLAQAAIKETELHEFIFSLRKQLHDEKDFYLYMAFREEYPQAWSNLIEEFFKNVGIFPLYELLISIYSRLDCLNHFPQAQGFFMHLLELVKEKEEEFTDITSFLEYFESLMGEDLYVELTDVDAIKVLTIHKAKGLEFPVVIIPFLGMDVQVGASSSDNQQSYVLYPLENQMQLLRLKSKYLSFSTELEEIYQHEYIAAFTAELNNVYVALTRAIVELHILIPKKISNSSNIVKFLIPENQYVCGNVKIFSAKKDLAKKVLDVSFGTYKDWIDYLKDEFVSKDQAIHRREIMHGELMHKILSFIHVVTDVTRDKLLEDAVIQAQDFLKDENLFSECQRSLHQMLNHKNIKPFFYISDARVFTEKEIINRQGQARRVDRLIIFKNEAWVVDFKSSFTTLQDYRKQISEYKILIKNIYPKHIVKGFLISLDKFEVEEV